MPSLSRAEARSLGGAIVTLLAGIWIAVGWPDLGQAAAAAAGTVGTILAGWLLGSGEDDDHALRVVAAAEEGISKEELLRRLRERSS